MTRVRTFRLSLPALLVIAGGFSAGCVSTRLPLAANHPARPGAPAGAAYNPAAILEASTALYQNADADEATASPDGTRANPFIGRGIIEEVREGALVIDHEAIPGFMGAMTMAYPVAAGVDTSGLEPGDVVTFRIERVEAGGFRIFAVEAVAGGVR